MARDLGLEELIRADLPDEPFTEKAMFGGWAWLLRGPPGLRRARGRHAGRGSARAATAGRWRSTAIGPMISRGRAMGGWVRAGPEAYGDDALRRGCSDAARRRSCERLPPK